jgi:AI-2 transport protein TqsA
LLPIPIAFAQFKNPWMVIPIVALPGTVHMTIGNFVEPKLMGKGLELHPVAVLLALALLGLMWGVIGMVLAVPIAAMVRIVLSRFTTTRALAELLAGELPGARPIEPML